VDAGADDEERDGGGKRGRHGASVDKFVRSR
jgi:hypothetical protein